MMIKFHCINGGKATAAVAAPDFGEIKNFSCSVIGVIQKIRRKLQRYVKRRGVHTSDCYDALRRGRVDQKS